MIPKHVSALARAADPFGEGKRFAVRVRRQVLGAEIGFDSNNRALLRIADVAYRRLPAHRFAARAPRLTVSLRLTADEVPHEQGVPPPLVLSSGAGFLCGTMNATNFALVAPLERRALVVASRRMLQHPYHLRYELIEFAVYVLAARVQHLVPLHAGCVGVDGRAALLIGASGAGKSTLALAAALDGMEFLSEDSVLVEPASLAASGNGSFLHVRTDSLDVVERAQDLRWIRSSPVIRRRSGVEKYEVDMRRSRCTLAPSPPRIRAVVFMSARRARGPLVARLSARETRERLRATQPYGVRQEGWRTLEQKLRTVDGFELRRGAPADAVRELRKLLDERR